MLLAGQFEPQRQSAGSHLRAWTIDLLLRVSTKTNVNHRVICNTYIRGRCCRGISLGFYSFPQTGFAPKAKTRCLNTGHSRRKERVCRLLKQLQRPYSPLSQYSVTFEVERPSLSNWGRLLGDPHATGGSSNLQFHLLILGSTSRAVK
jgi:hypothetical protein